MWTLSFGLVSEVQMRDFGVRHLLGPGCLADAPLLGGCGVAVVDGTAGLAYVLVSGSPWSRVWAMVLPLGGRRLSFTIRKSSCPSGLPEKE